MYKCKYCGKEFIKAYQIGAHVSNFHASKKKRKLLEKVNIVKNCIVCGKPFEISKLIRKGVIVSPDTGRKCCSKKCANSIGGHHVGKFKKITCKRCNILFTVRRRARNTGYCEICYKELNPSTFCTNCGKQLSGRGSTGLCNKCRLQTTEFRKKVLDGIKNSKKKMGGCRDKGGRGKYGRFRGIWCQSGWELAWVIYNIEHNIKFERNKKGFEYVYDNKTFKYYPDFILPDGSYVEIKGWFTEKTKAKLSQFTLPLEVIDRNKIKIYLAYVINKYGKDFIKLYDH